MIGKSILHYKILQKLGEGGMGVVYKAEDTKLERTVAIKLLPRHIVANSEERQRFKIEAKAAATLNNPNIATILAIETTEDDLFIVMEYLTGQNLKEAISTELGKAQHLDKILRYATQIAEAIETAHERGVVHGNIKSSKIMITQKGQAKIMDFGLARLRGGSDMIKQGVTLGTTAYMSPEQAKGETTDRRTDIWAFGVALYEMLTGSLPFKGEYEPAVVNAILHDKPKPITAFRPDTPQTLVEVTSRALAKDPNARYQQMGDMLADLLAVRINVGATSFGNHAASRKRSKWLIVLAVAGGTLVCLVLAMVFMRC
jgi:serine/threonine protein kinase